ncbi:hypothetical protein ASPFODRAFT_521258 [Aspergillus luchuensis CBS 106.47]|uniref:Uncharacterized protein n=1 Tax=Aspergillus luchuensis (strain CBS 106.47) TaxID=1137211 RepID=A0A1M3SZ31_ASPLC|nr:hypothetical protein ASPFODRAFT_521258 [Aspergillus luchuensis CBS 106.47]
MKTRARFDLLPRGKFATGSREVLLQDASFAIQVGNIFLLPRVAYGIPTAQLPLRRFCNGTETLALKGHPSRCRLSLLPNRLHPLAGRGLRLRFPLVDLNHCPNIQTCYCISEAC